MSYVPLPVGFDPLVNDLLREAAEATHDHPTISTTTVTAAVPSVAHAAQQEHERHQQRHPEHDETLLRELEADREVEARLRPRPSFHFDAQSQSNMTDTSSLQDEDVAAETRRLREPFQAADIPALHTMAASWAEATAEAVAEAACLACGEELQPLDSEGHVLVPNEEEHVTTVEMPDHEGALGDLVGAAADLEPPSSTASTTAGTRIVDLDDLLGPDDEKEEEKRRPHVMHVAHGHHSPQRHTLATQHQGSPLRHRHDESPSRSSSAPRSHRALGDPYATGNVNLSPTALGDVRLAHAAEAKMHANTAATMAAMAVDIAMHDGLMLGNAQTTDHALHAAGLDQTGLPFEPMDTIAEMPAGVPTTSERLSFPVTVTEDETQGGMENGDDDGAAATNAALGAREALLALRARGRDARRRHGSDSHAHSESDVSPSEASDREIGPARPKRVRNISTKSGVSLHSLSSVGSLQTTRFSAGASHPSEGISGHDFVPVGANVPEALDEAIVGASVVDQAPIILHEGLVPPHSETGTGPSSAGNTFTHVTTTGAAVSTPLARTVIVTTTTTTHTDVLPEESTTDPDRELEEVDQAAITTTTTTVVTYPKPQPSKKRPLLITLMVALLPLAVGYTLGFTSPIDLTEPVEAGGAGLSETDASFFGASVNLGAAAGALIGIPLLNTLGRRGSLMASGIPFAVGYLLLALVNGYTPLLFGRLLTGIGVGLGSLVAPTYLAEIAPPSLRGLLGIVYQLSTCSGILVVYGLGVALDWRTLAWVGFAIPTVFMVGMLPMPGSPSFLLSRGRRDAALKAMQRIRGMQYDCEGELALVERSMEAQTKATKMTLARLFQGANLRAMIVTLGAMTLLQMCGINSVVFFSGAIFEAANYEDPAIGALITAVINVVVTFLASLVVDRFGRRPLLLISMIGASASLGVLGAFFYLQDNGDNPPGLMALLSLMLYNVFFAIGLGPLPWLIASEVLPARARNLGSSVTVLYNWILAFIITKTFANMVTGLTSAGTFWFYAASVVPGLYYALRILPETKGRSLEDIEAFFTRLVGKPTAHAGGAGLEDTDLAVHVVFDDVDVKEGFKSEEEDTMVPERVLFRTTPAILGGQAPRARGWRRRRSWK